MQREVMFAGFGGQGVLISAKILACAAMKEEREVVWVPSYGPEMRGGTAYYTVVISNHLIGSPVIRYPGYLVAMNQPSLVKFAPMVKPNGTILINSSLITIDSGRQDIDELSIPANDLAMHVGDVRTANIVALSALIARTHIVDLQTLQTCVKSEFAKNAAMIPMNMAAVEQGQMAVMASAEGYRKKL
jgi:2-oxoglutarate ferredoxin oxidoreductase subunit gamma